MFTLFALTSWHVIGGIVVGLLVIGTFIWIYSRLGINPMIRISVVQLHEKIDKIDVLVGHPRADPGRMVTHDRLLRDFLKILVEVIAGSRLDNQTLADLSQINKRAAELDNELLQDLDYEA